MKLEKVEVHKEWYETKNKVGEIIELYIGDIIEVRYWDDLTDVQIKGTLLSVENNKITLDASREYSSRIYTIDNYNMKWVELIKRRC